ncbi:MAG: Cna B-type domain-containing protein [Eubacteriales bacterium]|nr:Cna B-type domain-containing protein [Eubacteriales bacterium]
MARRNKSVAILLTAFLCLQANFLFANELKTENEVNAPKSEEVVTMPEAYSQENEAELELPWVEESTGTLGETHEEELTPSEVEEEHEEAKESGEKLTVHFETCGGEPIEALEVEKGEVLTELPIPSFGDHVFLSWTDVDDKPIELPFTVEEDVTFLAVWKAEGGNPDHLAPDHIPDADGSIAYGIYPESVFAAAMLRSARSRSSNPPVIGVDHPAEIGETMFFKEAKEIPGLVNTWEIKLRMESRDRATSDTVLVIDTSGSMDGERLRASVAAAGQFIDVFLPSETNRIALVAFDSKVPVKIPLTNDASKLKAALKLLTAGGGTFTQAGIRQAAAMLNNSDAISKNIVLLSDGVPTYSYRVENPDDYLALQYISNASDDSLWGSHVVDGERLATTSSVPASAFTSQAVGQGTHMFHRYFNSIDPHQRKYYNHGNSAIAEAAFSKGNGIKLWAIGLSIDDEGRGILAQIASPGKFFEAIDADKLNAVYSEIAGQIQSNINDASVSDPMALGFEVPLGKIDSITTSQGTATYIDKKISWDPGPMTKPISAGSDIHYAELSYVVELNDDILSQTADENGEHPTNGDAVITYNDLHGNPHTVTFPVPTVKPVLYKVEKELQDKDGRVITADRNFNVEITGPGKDGDQTLRKYELNSSTAHSTKLMTDLRYVSDYSFEETGELSDYEVSYFVNGKESTSHGFNVPNANTEPITVKLVNREKPGSITVTKAFEQGSVRAGTRSARASISFAFELSGPNGYKQEFSLPEAGSWSKTFQDLAKGSYTLTEKTSGFETSMQVNDGSVIEGNTATLSIDIGQLEQSILVRNRVLEGLSLTATKTWVNAPAEKPEIYFQLIRVNSDASKTKIGAPRKVEADRVIWHWMDPDLSTSDFVQYDPSGQEYVYKVQEVNASGEDYTPAAYSKTETGLNVTNTNIEKTRVYVAKAWDDADNQDGVRPTSVTVKLLANGLDTGKTIELSAANDWRGTFSELDKYADGKTISYTVSEDEVGNAYESSITESDVDASELPGIAYLITNRRSAEMITVSGKKTWDDNENQDGKRPDKITIHLLQDGHQIDQKQVGEEQNWSWSFTDLPKYAKAKLITYSIEEEPVADYTTKIEGYNVINTHEAVNITLPIHKEWKDENNQDGVRPDSVTVKLLADGLAMDKTLTLSEANQWTGSFTDLPEYVNGKKIVYSVEEEAVANNYIASYSPTPTGGIVITNTHVPEIIDIVGEKIWDDFDNKAGLRPDKITIRLHKNGKEISSRELSADTGWFWDFGVHPKYEAGKEIQYTLTEDAVEGYSAKISNFNVTNTLTPGEIAVQVTKLWLDSDNEAGKRPSSVTVKLYADGKDTGKSVVLKAENKWTDVFAGLEKYKEDKKIVYSVREEVPANYEVSYEGNQEEGFKVINRFKEVPKPTTTPKPSQDPPQTSTSQRPRIPSTGEVAQLSALLGLMFLGAAAVTVGIVRKNWLKRK